MSHLNGKLIQIKWDRIQRDPTCITANGEPLEMVGHVKLEWGGNTTGSFSGGCPILTVEQTIIPQYGSPGELSQVHTIGYLVPIDVWDEYQRWLHRERREK